MMVLAFTGISVYSQSDIPLRKIKAARPSVQVNMLDSVKGDDYRKYYKYNEYGYITSVMVYNKDTDWTLDTDASYIQDYVFNTDGQCTERIRYAVNEYGKRSVIEEKGVLEVEDGQTWERYYERYDGKLHPSTAKAYDKWGNLTVEIEYEWDDVSQKDCIYSYTERQYSASTHPGHYYQSAFATAYCTYQVTLSTGSTKTMNADELPVASCNMNVWEQSGSKLYHKKYSLQNYEGDFTLSNVKDNLTLTGEDTYILNAAGTRPTSMTSMYFNGSEMTVSYYEEYIWDDKDRLLRCSRSYSNSDGTEYTDNYTYADDYVKEMSLMDAIYKISNELLLYPEDEACTFGRVATYSYERNWVSGTYRMKESNVNTYTWNANGQVVSGKWTETESQYDEDTMTLEEEVQNTEVYGYYNADGHLAYVIGIEEFEGEKEYFKEEYVYNQSGMWTGSKDYEGDSLEGPWRKDGKRSGRMAPRKAAEFIDDMSEGSHEIESDDGVFQTRGSYYVSGGKVTFGNYYQYFKNNASVPKNPELNYTEPAVPLEITDESDYSVTSLFWWYGWNLITQEWECTNAPEQANRIYYVGDNIVCDTYNSNKQITGTTIYTLDDEGRLSKKSSNGSETVYTYLSDGSDYLLKTSTTEGKKISLLLYYYSEHNYLSPAGIESAKSTAGETAIYDLQGRRVTTPSAHGIYIVNGKKIMK